MKNNGMIIVLGSPNSDEGKLFCVAKERCDRAYQLWHIHPEYKILLTGGFGDHFNTTPKPHAAYLKKYLLNLGIPENVFIEFAESRNTIEDASFSKLLLIKYGVKDALIITSDYHSERAQYIFHDTFVGSGIQYQFSITNTNESICEFDLKPIKRHEKEALIKLKKPC